MSDPKREEEARPPEDVPAEAAPREEPKPAEAAEEPLFPLPKMESIELGLPPAGESER